MSPYYMIHEVEPVLSFDLIEATYLTSTFEDSMSTEALISTCARQLQKRSKDLDRIARLVTNSRHAYVKHFAKVNKHVIKDYNFKLESLVLL